MKQEILDLIDIYENEEKYQQRISAALKGKPIHAPGKAKAIIISDIAEAMNIHEKISFDKNRQRAELLRLNEIFLKELSGIKKRLGEKFFRLIREEAETLEDY